MLAIYTILQHNAPQAKSNADKSGFLTREESQKPTKSKNLIYLNVTFVVVHLFEYKYRQKMIVFCLFPHHFLTFYCHN